MIIKDILNLAGSATAIVNPFIGGAITLINSFIPDGSDKIKPDSTVDNIKEFIERLPSALQDNLMKQEISLDNNYTDRFKTLTESKGQKVRAIIALLMTINIFIITVVFTVFISYSFFTDFEKLKDMSELWTVLLTLCGVPASVVQSYFGNARKEKGLLTGLKPESILDRIKLK